VKADGTFALKNVSGGEYHVSLTASSENLADYFTKAVNLNGRDVNDTGFAVAADTYLDVVVSANGASIAGKVVDAKGQGVPGATVVDIPSMEHRGRIELYQRAETDESGNFSLRGLSAGKYTVLAFEELQEDVQGPEILKKYQNRGETVEVDEGKRKSIELKLISAGSDTP
jgi:hypothetical protein